jgi:hypothetical protein
MFEPLVCSQLTELQISLIGMEGHTRQEQLGCCLVGAQSLQRVEMRIGKVVLGDEIIIKLSCHHEAVLQPAVSLRTFGEERLWCLGFTSDAGIHDTSGPSREREAGVCFAWVPSEGADRQPEGSWQGAVL